MKLRFSANTFSVWIRGIILLAVFMFLFAPIIIVMATSFDYGERAYIVFPPERFTFDAYLNIPDYLIDGIYLSIMVGLSAAFGASIIGIPAALGLVRGNMPGKSLIMTIFRIPLQIPGVVMGLAFLQAYYAIGAATDDPLPPCSTTTDIAYFGFETGAYPTNKA